MPPFEPAVGIRRHVPALDGLRFLAAFCVLMSHGFDYVVLLQNGFVRAYDPLIRGLAVIGMTLFFVLSGFVIHMNYSRSLAEPGGARRFFLARFSRLYPLFLLVFLVEFIRTRGQANGTIDILGPLPLYLTFTQSWWFWVFKDRVACMAYNGASGLMWSLSTEAFFYAAYAVFIFRVLPKSMGRLLGVYLGTAVAAILWVVLATNYRGVLMHLAGHYTGSKPAGEHFDLWLVFYSPWTRIFEFLLGAMAAQYVLIGGAFRRARTVIPLGAILVILGTYAFTTFERFPIQEGIMTCLSFLFALLLASVALTDTFISRILSARWLVAGGKASYSLYLLHCWVMMGPGVALAVGHDRPVRILLWIGFMLISIVVAQISYLGFERPAMRLIRKLSPSKAPGA